MEYGGGMPKIIGVAAHSAEGGALCFLTACREGAAALGPHMHPTIVMSAVPMGLSMPGWWSDDHAQVAPYLEDGVRRIAAAGAAFYVCPDNTAHLVLEQIAGTLALPGLHIADVVCSEITARGWARVGLLGTKWTMTGAVYERALRERRLERLIPPASVQDELNDVIFEELCRGIFTDATTRLFLQAIDELRERGAQCVVLGCTEIPLVVTERNSALPVLDSTRLLAKYAVREALCERPIAARCGWLAPVTDPLPV
jgi:aspartate racemase